MSTYDKSLKALADEYRRVWEIADNEKREIGKVSKKTKNALVNIENELARLESENFLNKY